MTTDEHTVLCVDDEANILHALKRALRKEGYRLLTAGSGEDALALMAENDIHVVISDQRMPKMSGTEFLARVKDDYPDAIRIILTGYTEVDSITESINRGHIYKFLLKPWNDQNLKLEIRQALDQYNLIEANRTLHRKVIEQNQALKEANENLESQVRERTKDLEIKNHALALSHTILEDLPIAIIGVSSEQMIVLINRQTKAFFGTEGDKMVGRRLGAYFPEKVRETVSTVISGGASQGHYNMEIDGKPCHIELHPLSGRLRGHGVVLALHPRDV